MKFNKRQDYVILINELFQSVFHKLKMNWNFNSWVIIRNQIGYFLHLIYIGKIDPHKLKNSPSAQIQLRFSFSDIFRLIKYYIILCKLKRKWKNKLRDKTLLVSWKTHNNNKNENIYITPFMKLLEENSEAYVLLETDGDAVLPILHFYSILSTYHSLLFKFRSLFSIQIRVAENNSKIVSSFFENSGYLPDENLVCAKEIQTMIFNNILENQKCYKIYHDFLETTSPKLIWTYNYYETSHLALCRVANTLNIPIVEYQHSVISSSHFAYSKWEQISLYAEHFPSHFWAWDNASSNIYLENFSNDYHSPQIIVGGNLSIMLQKKTIILEHIQKRKDKILVCLQGNWIPQFIEDFIAENDTYTWYFRSHPRYPAYEEKITVLKERFPKKVEIELANSLPLYDLFSIVEYNLTSFSGTAMEAYAFGIKNIIFGEDGYDTYQNQIDNQLFAYVQSKEELEQLLNDESFHFHEKNQSEMNIKISLSKLYNK